MTREQVVVIGAGPGGLAVAAGLGDQGVEALVVDRAADVGSSWRNHYERLHLHTPRRWSGLPGYPIPRRFGRWVARDDVVHYLEEYVEHHGIRLRLGTAVTRVERAIDTATGAAAATARWVVRFEDDTTITANHVVVATGYNHTPVTPDWPGVDGFTGDLVLARDYRNGRPFAGRDVLVVGTGNTGTEIATDLAEHGATRVWLAVRTPPHIIRRDMLGWPAQGTGILVRRLPPKLVDRVARGLSAVQEPDLRAYGMPRATVRGSNRMPCSSPPATAPASIRSSATSGCSTGEACRSSTVPTSPPARRGCGSPASPTRSRECCASCASTANASPPPSRVSDPADRGRRGDPGPCRS